MQSARHITQFIQTGFLIAGLCFASSSHAISNCSVTRVSNTRIDALVKSRVISLVGYSHLNADSSAELSAVVDRSLEFSKAGKCSLANDVLSSARTEFQEKVETGDRAISDLTEAISGRKNIRLGVELDPQEVATIYPGLDLIDQKLQTIQDNCPVEALDTAAQFRKLLPGPAYYTAQKFGITTEGLENEFLKSQAKEALQVAGERIQISNDDMTDESFNLFLKLQALESPITEAVIAQVLAGVRTQDARTIVDRQLRAMENLRVTNQARDAAIAEYIAKNPYNYAVLIGLTHLDDLALRLYKTCQKNNP